MGSYYSVGEMSDEEILDEISNCIFEKEKAEEKVQELLDGLVSLKRLEDLKGNIEGAGVFINDDGGWGFMELACNRSK